MLKIHWNSIVVCKWPSLPVEWSVDHVWRQYLKILRIWTNLFFSTSTCVKYTIYMMTATSKRIHFIFDMIYKSVFIFYVSNMCCTNKQNIFDMYMSCKIRCFIICLHCDVYTIFIAHRYS